MTIGPSNKALKRTKCGKLLVGALRAPSSLGRASPLSAVLCGPDHEGTQGRLRTTS